MRALYVCLALAFGIIVPTIPPAVAGGEVGDSWVVADAAPSDSIECGVVDRVATATAQDRLERMLERIRTEIPSTELAAACKATGEACSATSECCAGLTCSYSRLSYYCY